jgi:hypothetical protein
LFPHIITSSAYTNAFKSPVFCFIFKHISFITTLNRIGDNILLCLTPHLVSNRPVMPNLWWFHMSVLFGLLFLVLSLVYLSMTKFCSYLYCQMLSHNQ